MKNLFLIIILFITFTKLSAEENTLSSKFQTLKVGVVLGLTGPASSWAESSRHGLEIARDEINTESVKNNKPKLELIFEDSQSNPTSAVNAFRKLISLNKVNIVIGDVWGYLTNAMVPIAETTQTILASPVVFKESIEKANPYFFSMGEKAESLSNSLDKFYKTNPSIKKIGIFCWEDNWGQAYYREWKNAAKRNGIEIAEESCTSDFNFDFKLSVTKMKIKKVDAVFITYKTSVILQRLREQKFSPIVFSSSDIVEDLISRKQTKELFDLVYLSDWKPSSEFFNKYKDRYKNYPVNQSHDSYYLLKAIYEASLKNSGSLKDNLKQIKLETNLGHIDFSKDNFGNFGVASLYQIKDGSFKLIE